MAAGLVLGGAGLVSAQDQQPSQTEQRIQETQQRLQQTEQQAEQRLSQQLDQAQQAGAQSGGQGMQQAQQVDQQIMKQMQQLQQSPQGAADKLFVLNAAITNMYEIQLSQQAQQKAQSQEVKQLAQMIIKDHQQATQQLQQVAQSLQVQVPQGLPSLKQQEIQILSSLPAEQFEKQYVAKMNELHAMDVTAFGSQTTLAQNQQLKQFVTQTLPKLQQHQQHVLKTASAIGLTGGQGDAQQAGSSQSGSSSEGNAGPGPSGSSR